MSKRISCYSTTKPFQNTSTESLEMFPFHFVGSSSFFFMLLGPTAVSFTLFCDFVVPRPSTVHVVINFTGNCNWVVFCWPIWHLLYFTGSAIDLSL